MRIIFLSVVLLFFAQAAFSEDEPTHKLKIESTITGDNEQPAVSYFVPWKDVGTPDKLQWQLDEKYDDTEWIKLSRLGAERYTVTGKDGKLPFKLTLKNYPRDIIKVL